MIELVVVIAVIAILAAVSVVSYVAITNKAKESNDHSMIDQINLSVLSSSTLSKKNTLHDVLEDLKEDAGFGVEKLKPELKDAEFVYSRSMNKFAYWKDNKVVYPTDVANNSAAAGVDLWFFKDVDESGSLTGQHSYYVKSSKASEITTDGGLDVGSQAISKVTYLNSDASKEVLIRTAGGTLQLGTGSGDSEIAKGTIIHYGNTDKAVVYTSGNSFHTHGAVGRLEVKAGKAVVEENGIAYLVEAKASGVELVEKDGGRFIIPAGVTTEDIPATVAEKIGYTTTEDNYDNATTTGDKSYQIGSLEALESFRDLVNGGFNFSGVTVKLTSSITLKDGWKPIGEGSRDVTLGNYKGSYLKEHDGVGASFAGTFDGNNKVISNLNSTGYVPTLFSVDGDHLNFVYGFFGILYNATIKDLAFNNVNIDFLENVSVPTATTEQKLAKADSVAALAGFVAEGCTISGITVNGTIKASDAVGGIIGRAYGIEVDSVKKDGSVSISNCVNNATVYATGDKAAGILGYAKRANGNKISVSLSDNVNNGQISSKCYAAGIATLQDLGATCVASRNENKADISVAEYVKDKNGNDSAVGIAHVCMGIGFENYNATNNSSTSKAYLAGGEIECNLVSKNYPKNTADPSSFEKNTNPVL